MAQTHVAFLLHMHQPLYVDPSTGRAEMPWVRLHATRGYLDVATLLEQHPSVSLTVNFVPSLVEQLERCAAGAGDRYLEIARQPAWELADRQFLLERFFSVNWGRNVEVRPRYRELLEKRGRDPRPGELAARAAQFAVGELRDLTVLFHLAWLGFAARADATHGPAIADLEKKGRGFDDKDLAAVIACGQAACARVLPLYRALAARRQIELSSSPYYHPIVPLLADSDAARRALPHAALPERFAWPDDAREQIRLGREAHARAFGAPPAGMWPPEGSLSPEAVAAYRAEGIGWLATDEGNLWRSLDLVGGPRPRGELYRAWRHEGIDLVFRDRELSDRIGFSYAHSEPGAAVADLLGRVRHAGALGKAAAAPDPPLVPVILDGENPWEAYPGSGEPFLRTLFTALSHGDVRAVSIGGHLGAHTARAALPRLHSGSWIDSDFHIWIGDPVKNRAWELLGRARRRYQRAVERGIAVERAREALRHLLAAEGSDWFWWFGEPFHSAEDALFDRLFRAHLAAAWSALGDPVPAELGERVAPAGAGPDVHPPRGLIAPVIDGRIGSYFEWIDAGRYEVPRGGAMASESQRALASALWFGFDARHLYLRLDPSPEGRARLRSARIEVILRTPGREVQLSAPLTESVLEVCERGLDGPEAESPWTRGAATGRLALDEVVELQAGFAALGLAPGTRVELAVRLHEGEVVLARYPLDGYLGLRVPDEGFAADHWSV
jgi:alpha-amylase/alpha-mannosidase (GH57 family)